MMLRLSTQNSKTGPSFNLPAGNTCPGKTEICADLCYVKGGRMGLKFQTAVRDNNLLGVIEHLKAGNLPNALDRLVKRGRISTLRIHDSGDFFSAEYTRAWELAVRRNPQIQFWAYTRSFNIAPIWDALLQLATAPNMALWVSADEDNWQWASVRYFQNERELAGIAFMQTEDTEQIARSIQERVGVQKFVNFPAHTGRGKHLVSAGTGLRSCPVLTGALAPDWRDPPCIKCQWCLPAAEAVR